MIYDGFFDRYRKLKIIAAHGGGALPYLISRMDQCFDNIPACREKISVRPSEYLPRIYADAVVFSLGRARAVRQDVWRRQRTLRVGLSAHHRRHAGLSQAGRCARRRRARQGARWQRPARIQFVGVRLAQSRSSRPVSLMKRSSRFAGRCR